MGHYSDFYAGKDEEDLLRRYPSPETWLIPMSFIQKAEIGPVGSNTYKVDLPRDLRVKISKGIQAQENLANARRVLTDFREMLKEH